MDAIASIPYRGMTMNFPRLGTEGLNSMRKIFFSRAFVPPSIRSLSESVSITAETGIRPGIHPHRYFKTGDTHTSIKSYLQIIKMQMLFYSGSLGWPTPRNTPDD